MIPMQYFEEMPKEELLAYLREHARKQLEGCTRLTTSGISILTPDGMGNYDALWARDFAYMAEYAGDLISTERLREGVEYLLLWRVPGANYLCIEPWWGVGGFEDDSFVLAEKRGIHCVEGKETFAATHTIEFA